MPPEYGRASLHRKCGFIRRQVQGARSCTLTHKCTDAIPKCLDLCNAAVIFSGEIRIIRQKRAGEDEELPVPVIDHNAVLGQHEAGIVFLRQSSAGSGVFVLSTFSKSEYTQSYAK